jgi:signal transduction histidine kinase
MVDSALPIPAEDLEKLSRQVIRGLSAFRRIGEIQSLGADIDAICTEAVRVFVEELDFENCSILLLEGDELRLKAALGKRDSDLSDREKRTLNRDLRIKIGEGVAGQVVRTGKPFVANDAQNHPQFKAFASAIKVRSLLCFPLFSKKDPIGVINLSHPDIEEVSANLEEVLYVLSRMVGHLITISRLNIELLREQFQRTERLASVGQLAASVAHEVNNPLTNILLRAQKIQLDGMVSDDIRTTAFQIEEASEKIQKIVGRLLDFSRNARSEKVSVDLNEVIMNSLLLTEPFLKDKGKITIEKKLQTPIPSVVADRNELEQVFTNLIVNAAEAMCPEGGRLTLSTALDPVGKVVRVSVQDTGRGISKQDLPRIFDPFFTLRPDGQGTGLGLAICRDLVRGHSGDIEVDSTPGQGTVFAVVLPC